MSDLSLCKGLLIAIVLLTTRVSGDVLAPPERTVDIPGVFTMGEPVPKWDRDVFLARRYKRTSDDNRPNLIAYDRAGQQLMTARVWFPDAWMVLLFDASRSPSGVVAVTGVAYSPDGVAAGFLAYVAKNGQVERAVRTAPFTGERITFGPDGSVWLLGQVAAGGGPRSQPPDHGIVRQFGPDGKFVREILLRSTFPGATLHPALNTGDGAAFVAVNNNTVGIFSVVTDEWVESNMDGTSVHHWPITPLSRQEPAGTAGPASRKRRLTGIAMTADGKIFGSFIDRSGNSLYRLQPSVGVWTQTTLGSGNEDFGWLLGIDGSALVYRATGHGIIRWASPQ